MRTKFKAWAEPFIKEHPEVMCPFDNLNEYIPYYLEIGSGKGQFLTNMALNHPELTFLGIERNVTCSGFTAKKLVENEVKNAKLVFANAEFVLPNINSDSVKGIFLNFSAASSPFRSVSWVSSPCGNSLMKLSRAVCATIFSSSMESRSLL